MGQIDIKLSRNDLFPTRIWIFDLDVLQPHFAAWQQAITARRAAAPQPAGRSLRGGWNSPTDLLRDPLFAPLADVARQCFQQAFKEMQAALPYRLDGWANVHDGGGSNIAHVHPNVLLSGSFYLALPPGSGQLVFRDPRAGAVLSPYAGPGINNAQQYAVTPKEGQLVLFPNWLEHYVEASTASAPRIAIGINALAA